jgi:hypothetical protein|tara:strand:- start:904 stop:1764 length:861 start_codon:yes stop_codon:yes gene_type:complete
MENQEVIGNAQDSAPDSTSNVDASREFFAALDGSLNQGILEGEQKATSDANSSNILSQSPQEVQEVTDQSEGNLMKRYQDSSREAKRLYDENKSMEPYIPIINAMKEDPQLIRHVRGYFEGGGEAPKSMKERMGLEDDFIFDADEALSNPESDSAKMFGATVDGIVQQRLAQSQQQQNAVTERAAKENDFKGKHNLSTEEWNDYKNFAKTHKLTFDDILYLKNKDTREANIQQNANENVARQMQKVQSAPGSLATTGSAQVETNQDDSVFDILKGVDSQLESAFGT